MGKHIGVDICDFADENGECDCCIDNRVLEVVWEYASTCDGCSEMTHHDLLTMDKNTQLGYCPECIRGRQYPENANLDERYNWNLLKEWETHGKFDLFKMT